MQNREMLLSVQVGLIKSLYPSAKIRYTNHNCIIWVHTITPHPLSANYKIKLVYHLGKSPKIFVIDPKPLPLASGKTELEHVYDQKAQRLCLYYPDDKEWNSSMALTRTIIPWSYEWLYHYEIWLGTGVWTGGGIHIPNNKTKRLDK